MLPTSEKTHYSIDIYYIIYIRRIFVNIIRTSLERRLGLAIFCRVLYNLKERGAVILRKVNYQLMLDKEIENILAEYNGNNKRNKKKTLLLHACCAPCSSYVLEYLSSVFDITVFYYNPNITSENEYRYRTEEVKRLIDEMKLGNSVKFTEGKYDTESFFDLAEGHEKEPEGGGRCFACYRLRLGETAEYAKKNNFDYFTTTLSISPYKNAEKLNLIGKELGEKYGVRYLFSDFKKKNGYKRSLELSEKYNLYRQNYCGCIYSYEDMKRRKNLCSDS